MRTGRFLAYASILGLTAAACALPSAAMAQAPAATTAPDNEASEDDAIIVTAQRRAEASRDVPITVTTLSADQLATANVNQLSDISKLTPGLRFDTQAAAMQPTIRGVGTAVTTSGGGPNVGIYVDGFFQANTYVSDFQLMRVRNIQVLKGPQGTLFGRNTTGGAILVTTADPSTTTGAEFKASYGRFNSLNLQGYATFGLGERVAMDVEGLFRRGDGYFTDRLAGNEKVGKYRNWSVRTGLKGELSDSVSLLLRYSHMEVRDPATQLVNAFVDTTGEAGFLTKVTPAGRAIYGKQTSQGLPLVYLFAPAATVATRPGDIRLNPPVSFKSNSDTVQGTIKADIGFADFTSYTQYRHDRSPYYGDLDATAVPLFGLYVSPVDKTFSQEFLFNSKPGSALQWTAGLNYFQVRDTWDVGAILGGMPQIGYGGSTTNTKSYAAFVDLTYAVTDQLFLTAGARYSHDIVTDANFRTNPFTAFYEGPTGNIVLPTSGAVFANNTVIPVADLKKDSVTPRFVIRYKPDTSSSIYASYTRGYKAGILNVGGLSQLPVKPEHINAFELGYKYDDRTFAADLAGFYYDYKNLQVSSYQSGAAQIRNAASSEVYGLEAQLRYRVTGDFQVHGGAAWTHARYKSFPNAPFYSYCDPSIAFNPLAPNVMACVPPALGGFGPGALTQPRIDASGFRMQRSPEFTGNLGASYGLDLANGRLTLSGNLYYTSSFYFDPQQQFRQKGYELLSLRAEWQDPSERFTLALYGDNVTGRRYQTQVLFNTVGIGSVWSAPATYGIALGAKF